MRTLNRNRSCCASGNGYVPSYSIGFCVAITKNGAGRGSCWPSRVTPRSSIASSRADWTFAGARLISSASRMFVKIGPRRSPNVLVARSKTEVPRMSAGIRSGVNWTRPYSRVRARAIALASKVLPVPGTPSRSTWPCAMSAMAHSRSADERAKPPAAEYQAEEDRDQQPQQRSAPWGRDPRLRREIARRQSVVVLVERYCRARARRADEICKQNPVVGFLEVAVAQDERVGQDDDVTNPELLHVPRDKTVGRAQERYLGGRRIQRHDRIAAGHSRHAGKRRRRRRVSPTPGEAVESADPKRAVELRVALLRGVDEKSAAVPHPLPQPVGLVSGIGTRRREDEHHTERRGRVKRPGHLRGLVPHRLRKKKHRRCAVGGIAAGAVLGRVRMRLQEIDSGREQDREHGRDDPASSRPHAASCAG